MKIYLAVGHGIQPNGVFDPGAVSGSHSEQTWGDDIVAIAAKTLRAAGLTVKDEAHQDDPNFVGSTAAANAWGADLTVAVHHDWSGGLDSAYGFWWPGSTKGEKAARLIVAAIGTAGFPTNDRWTKARDDLYILRKTNHPCTLIEVGRIGDSSLDTKAEREQMGLAIAAGIAKYAGVSLPTPSEPEVAEGWKFPKHVETLMKRGIYTDATKPGANVDTDNLSAYLDRMRHLYETRDNQQRREIAEAQDRIAKLHDRVLALEAASAKAGLSEARVTDIARKTADIRIGVHSQDPDAHHD